MITLCGEARLCCKKKKQIHSTVRPKDTLSYRRLFAVLFGVLLLTACSKQTTAPVGDSRYRRPPLVTVEPEQLTLQNLLLDAKLQQELGNNVRAMEMYGAILKEHPDYAAAHYEMGQLLGNQLRIDSAIVHSEQAVAGDPDNVWYKLQCATLYRERGDHAKLIAVWESIVAQNPNVLEYYYELANAYMNSGDPKGAVATLNRVEKMVGVNEQLSLTKQKVWLAAGDEAKANKEIETLAATLPHNSSYNAILAESYMKSKNYPKAKEYYDKILAANPDDEYIHISLAQYYRAIKEEEKAYREMKQGFANPKLDCATKVQLLVSFYTLEEFYTTRLDYSSDLLRDAMQQCEDTITYARLYGSVLMQKQQFAEAAKQFKLHITRDSSDYHVWEWLLICESETEGNDEELLSLARRAKALFPLHNLPYYMLGVHAYTQGDYETAIEELQQCEQVGFTKGHFEIETYSLLAECHHALGDDDNTFAYYDKVLKIKPNDAGTLNNYAYYLSQRGERLEEALLMSEKAVKQEPHNATFLDTYAWVLYKLGRYDEARKQMQRCLENDRSKSKTLQKHWEVIKNAK